MNETSLSLFQIERELLELVDLRESLQEELAEGGPLPPDEQVARCKPILEALAEADKQIKFYLKREVSKVDGIANAIKQFEAVSAQSKEEADRLAVRAKSLQAVADSIRERVIEVMEDVGQKKLRGGLNTLTVSGNGGVQPLDIRQPDLIPEAYMRVTVQLPVTVWRELLKTTAGLSEVSKEKEREPDNALIRGALNIPVGVPGCILKERGKHLRIT